MKKHYPAVALLFVFVFVSGILVSDASALLWQKKVFDDTEWAAKLSLVVDNNDNPHLTYLTRNNLLLHKHFTGTDWATSIIDYDSSLASLAMDSGGELHAAYMIENHHLAYAQFDGQNWQSDVIVPNLDEDFYPLLAMDSADRPHILSNNMYTWYDGVQWATDFIDNTLPRSFSFVLDSLDNPHITYNSESANDLIYTHHDGQQWLSETIVAGGTVGLGSSLVLDRLDRPHVAYYDIPAESLKYAHHDGSQWQIETVVTHPDYGVPAYNNLSLALDAQDQPHILFALLEGELGEYTWNVPHYGYFDGVNWNIESLADPGGDPATNHAGRNLAVDSLGRPHLVYFTEMPWVVYKMGIPIGGAKTVTNCTDFSGPGGLEQVLLGGGAITFACDGTIDVQQMIISHDTSLDANGRDVTLRANPDEEKSIIVVNPDTNLSLRGLVLSGGGGHHTRDIGGVLVNNKGQVTIEDCLLNDTGAGSGGAVFNYKGTMAIERSQFRNNIAYRAGALTNSGGIVTINESSFSDNIGDVDGAISNHDSSLDDGNLCDEEECPLTEGVMTITNSTIYDNYAWSGGGINNNDQMQISNSTISRNHATEGPGGGIFNEGTLEIDHTTFANNSASESGGGLYNRGSLSLINIIVTNSSGGDCDTSDESVSGSNNLIDTACGGAQNLGPVTAFDLQLRDNGGPTLTHALLQDSSAIDTADPAFCPAADQRGLARPQRAGCDIGAVELNQLLAPSTVTDCQDYDAPGGLREALIDGGAITFACDGTIIVPQLDMLHDTTLDAAGHDVTLSGNHSNRVISVYPAVNLALSGLTIADGGNWSENYPQQGGGIYIDQGIVTIADSRIENHAAESGGAIFNLGGTMTLDRSVVSDSIAIGGGGIYNGGGILTLTSSTISGNTGDYAGGIYNGSEYIEFADNEGADMDGHVSIQNSTIANNRGLFGGAGLENKSHMEIVNSTISGNKIAYPEYDEYDGGGILNNYGGQLSITNSTLFDNLAALGGGIANRGNSVNPGSITINNTLFHDNTGGDCSDPFAVTAGQNNLFDGACGAAENLGPVSGFDADLADNGGPTLTHAIFSGSSAIDTADPAFCPVTDQRGISRPQLAGCDIGAFEHVPPPPFLVNNIGDAGDENPGDRVCQTAPGSGLCTLRAAIEEADAAPGADTINFDPALQGQTILLDGRQLEIKSEILINGPGADLLVVDANGRSSVILIQPREHIAGEILLAGLTISGGQNNGSDGAWGYGAGVIVEGYGSSGQYVTRIKDSVIAGNHAIEYGGGVLATGQANLIIDNCDIARNISDSRGGGLALSDNNGVQLINSTIRDNTAQSGAGIDSIISNILIAGSTISGNQAGDIGGAFRGDIGLTSIINSTISGNHAANEGSAIYLTADPYGVLNINSSTIAGNVSATGSAIYRVGETRMKNSIVTANSGAQCAAGTLLVGSGNLIDDASCGLAAPDLGPVSEFDPTLADNGGPTFTHVLLRDSSAIDAVTDCTIDLHDYDFSPGWFDTVFPGSPFVPGSVLTIDQRGIERPQVEACDSGSYEWEYVPTPVEATEELIEDVKELVAGSALENDHGMIDILDNVKKSLEKGNMNAACGQLGAFVNKVNRLVETGKFTAEQGQGLIDSADNIRGEIGC